MAGKLQGAYFTIWSVCSFFGGALVLLLVRGFFFNDSDEMYWAAIWYGSGGISFLGFMGTSTFAKLASCFGLGGLVVGGVIFYLAMYFFD